METPFLFKHFSYPSISSAEQRVWGKEMKNDKWEHRRLLNETTMISEIFLTDNDWFVFLSSMWQKTSFQSFWCLSTNPRQYEGCKNLDDVNIHMQLGNVHHEIRRSNDFTKPSWSELKSWWPLLNLFWKLPDDTKDLDGHVQLFQPVYSH